jgi:hypothetical protein
MSRSTRALLAALSVAAMLSVAAGTATASRLQITNNERGFRITWPDWTVAAGGIEVECAVTLEGTFVVRSFAKPAFESFPFGVVTRKTVSSCSGGSFAFLSDLYRLRYMSFEGTLPNITALGLGISNIEFSIEDGRSTCLTLVSENFVRGSGTLNGRRQLTELILDEAAEVPFIGLCEMLDPAQFSGTGTVTGSGGSGNPEFTLI